MATYETPMNKNKKAGVNLCRDERWSNINIVAYYANQQKQLNNYLS